MVFYQSIVSNLFIPPKIMSYRSGIWKLFDSFCNSSSFALPEFVVSLPHCQSYVRPLEENRGRTAWVWIPRLFSPPSHVAMNTSFHRHMPCVSTEGLCLMHRLTCRLEICLWAARYFNSLLTYYLLLFKLHPFSTVINNASGSISVHKSFFITVIISLG